MLKLREMSLKEAAAASGDLVEMTKTFYISCSRAAGAHRRNFERESPSAQTELHQRTTVGAWESRSHRVNPQNATRHSSPLLPDSGPQLITQELLNPRI
jgi:hypothetical protein